MKIGRIIHQQMMQLRWHFLACLGLLMALPIEEGIINVREGEGFYASALSLGLPLTVAPLLAGLIACANVQADLDDRRYIFWRSEPVDVKSFMAIKYLVGLVMAFVVIALPVAFAWGSSVVADADKFEPGFTAYMVNFLLISLAAYSVCFFCNVLVRKTARAWLIGMAMVVFLLLVPFVLPLNFKDVSSDFLLVASIAYLSVTLVPALVAFVVSLIAASRNWHLQTNLKGLLWTGAALIFLVMMLFTRQVANIKVIDEVEIPRDYACVGSLQKLYSNTREWHFFDIETSNDKIVLKDVYAEPPEILLRKLDSAKQLYSVGEKGLSLSIYPHFKQILYKSESDIFHFKLNTYHYREKIGKRTYKRKHRKAYLCGHKLLEELYPLPVSVLDLSDCVDEEGTSNVGIRQIGDMLVVLIQDGVVVVQIKADGGLELIDKKINGLKGYSKNLVSRNKVFKIPLVPTEGIDIKDRIKLTIDVNYRYIQGNWRHDEDLCTDSLVDINGDEISFCLLNATEISRFDVVNWDGEYIYCEFRDERPFTFLEQMFGEISHYDPYFIRDGKLYAYGNQKFLVFDVRSGRIRKLGHFQRLSHEFHMNYIEVLDDGNILVHVNTGLREFEDGSRSTMNSLYLLKNPE